MSILKLDQAGFESLIKNEKIVLVDFWATWCGPCKMVAPIVEKLALKYKGKISVGKIDIGKEPVLAKKYQVMSIPTILIFKNGELVKEVVGLRSPELYEKMIESVL